MSKTYTFALANLESWYGSSSSSTLDFGTQHTSNNRIGRTSSERYAVSCRPTSSVKTQMTPLYNLYAQSAANIESITLTLVTTTAKSYDMTPYGGKLAGSTKTKITNPVELTWAQGDLTGVFDLTASGISSQCGWAVGDSRNKVTYTKVDSASVTIVTAETDYKLKYNANGGSGAPSQQSGTGIGSYSFTVSSTIPVWEGHNFLGWATSASATTATYHGGDTYTATGSGTTVTKTLYAVWEEVSTGGFHIKTASGFVEGTPYVKTASGIVEGTTYIADENGTLHPTE